MAFKLGRQDSAIRRKVLLESSKQVILLARACLSDEKFLRYKEKALAHRAEVLKQIFKYKNPNPTEYAFELRELLAVADFSLLLLEDIGGEAKSGVDIEPKKEEDKGAGGD